MATVDDNEELVAKSLSRMISSEELVKCKVEQYQREHQRQHSEAQQEENGENDDDDDDDEGEEYEEDQINVVEKDDCGSYCSNGSYESSDRQKCVEEEDEEMDLILLRPVQEIECSNRQQAKIANLPVCIQCDKRILSFQMIPCNHLQMCECCIEETFESGIPFHCSICLSSYSKQTIRLVFQ